MKFRPQTAIVLLSVGAFLLAHLGSEICLRMWLGRDDLLVATREAFRFFFAQPIGTILLFVPFGLTGWMAASLVKKRGALPSYILLAVGITMLFALYFWGHWGEQTELTRHGWTAATLAIAMLPILSLPILAILLIARIGLATPRTSPLSGAR